MLIKIILDTIINFKKGNIDINEIEDTKAETIFSHRYSFEYIEYLGIAISFQEIYSKYSDYFKFEQKIRKVNRKQINEIAHKYLDINQLKITHFGKNKLDIEKVEEIITQAQQKPFSIKKKNKKLEIATLDNGLKIVLKKTKYKPVVGLGLSVGVSQLNENANNLGINNLTASLIPKGNEKYTFNELMNNLARNGIHFAIIPNMNNTSIVMKCFTEINDYPNSYCHVLWRELIFGKNSNLVQKIGYKETIEEITRQHIQNWYNQFFKANNITLSIVGDIDFEKVLYTCDAFLGKLPKGENHIQNLAIKKPSTEHYREKNLHHSFNTQSIIVLGGFAPNLFSQEHLSKEFGIYTITALTSKANEKIVIQKIKEKLQNIVKNGINDEELSITINQMKGSIISEFESNLYQAQSYAIAEQIAEQIGLGYMYVEDKVKRLENVRKDEIQKLANQYFNNDNFYLQVVR